MPRGDGTIAPSARSCGTAARSCRESCSRRALRCVGERTSVASMSSANESNCSPSGVLKLIAASDRRRSRLRSVSDGRYHATICSPLGVRGLDEAATRSGRTMSRLHLVVRRLEEERRTPCSAIAATELSGRSSTCGS